MSSHAEIDCLTEQLRAVLLNQPIPPELRVQSEELQELQGAVDYISTCLGEVQAFLASLCAGRLNVSPPGRHNFTANHLKELHSILKHLTWQTSQVANGDYSQHVHFLGEFSDSFNVLTAQLREREQSIATKTEALTRSMALLKIILDVQQDWVVVLDAEERRVIFANASAKRKFFNPDVNKYFSTSCQLLMEQLFHDLGNGVAEQDPSLLSIGTVFFSLRCFPVEWESRRAFVYFISDVTNAQEEKELLQDMAFKDTLTVSYNRRYCMQKIETLLNQKTPYSMVLIDLDDLKQVNDVQGHLSGDDYLITVSECITSFLRPKDRLCRVGGDEFVLLLPECSEENAQKKLTFICQQLGLIERPYPIQISYGVVLVNSEEALSLEDLLALADERMYAMKQSHKQ